MHPMEESTASFPVLYSILNWSILGGGSIAAVYVWRRHCRNPPNRAACTEAIVARAWDTIHLGILLFAIVLLFLLGSGCALFFQEEQLPAARLVIIILIYALLLFLVSTLNRKRGMTWQETFGMGSEQLRLLRLAPVLYLAAIPFLMIATRGYHWALYHWFDLEITMQNVAQTIAEERAWLETGYILATVIAAPIYEELIYRGILFPYIARQLGVTGGVLAVSVIFALTHSHLPSILPLFLLSSVLCLAYWRTGSLWVSIGIHAIFNAVGTLAIKLLY
jgi:membrane protease YdiL (CAAX protease family)